MNNTSLWTYVFFSFGKLPRRELQGHMLIVHMQDSTDRAAWRAMVHGGHTVRHDWATNTFTFSRSVVSNSLRPHDSNVAHQAHLFTGFSRQECWSGLPFPPPGDPPDSGTKPASPTSPALAEGSFFFFFFLTTEPLKNP